MSKARQFMLMVRRMPWTCGKEELQQHFSQYGKLRNVSIPYNKNVGLHRGYGFVTFATRDSLDKAISSRHIIDGSLVQVQESIKSSSISDSDDDIQN